MSEKDLAIAASRLARSAPEAWKVFITALGDYTEDKCIECISSQIDMLQVAQGRAQALVKLGRLLEDCNKTVESIEKAQANKPPPTARRP